MFAADGHAHTECERHGHGGCRYGSIHLGPPIKLEDGNFSYCEEANRVPPPVASPKGQTCGPNCQRKSEISSRLRHEGLGDSTLVTAASKEWCAERPRAMSYFVVSAPRLW